jgi:hypothetical protein
MYKLNRLYITFIKAIYESQSNLLFGSPEIKSGEKYLLIILNNSAKDYLERFREGFCFQIQYFLDLQGWQVGVGLHFKMS